MPAGPITADPTPAPMVISVAGLAVARKTLPARRDEAAAPMEPKSGCSQALSITPPDSKGCPASHESRRTSLTSRPRSTTAISGYPSCVKICPTGWRGNSCRRPRISTVFSITHSASHYDIPLPSGPSTATRLRSTSCGCATWSTGRVLVGRRGRRTRSRGTWPASTPAARRASRCRSSDLGAVRLRDAGVADQHVS